MKDDSEQRELDFAPLVPSDVPAGATIEERFQAFHGANPHVYSNLARLCLRQRERGLRRWGIKAAFEILRFQALETAGEEYKLNNSYAPLYARLLVRRHPELREFFELRNRRTRRG